MERKALTIILFIFFIGAQLSTAAYAQSSSLLINPESTPLFNETNWVPGSSISKTITVTNLSETDTYLFGIATFDEQDVDELATQLKLEIIDQYGTVLYGTVGAPKTLADLFSETEYSTVPDQGTEITLLTLVPNDTHVVTMKVSFPEESGNEWQDTQTVFSFGLGYTGSILGETTTAGKITEKIEDVLGTTGQATTWVIVLGGILLLIAGAAVTLKRKKD